MNPEGGGGLKNIRKKENETKKENKRKLLENLLSSLVVFIFLVIFQSDGSSVNLNRHGTTTWGQFNRVASNVSLHCQGEST